MTWYIQQLLTCDIVEKYSPTIPMTVPYTHCQNASIMPVPISEFVLLLTKVKFVRGKRSERLLISRIANLNANNAGCPPACVLVLGKFVGPRNPSVNDDGNACTQ
jgi:hypothetical protein